MSVKVRHAWEVAGLPGRYSMLGHRGHAAGVPCKWRFAGGSMMAHFKWFLGPSVPPSARGNKQIGASNTKLSGSLLCFEKFQLPRSGFPARIQNQSCTSGGRKALRRSRINVMTSH